MARPRPCNVHAYAWFMPGLSSLASVDTYGLFAMALLSAPVVYAIGIVILYWMIRLAV